MIGYDRLRVEGPCKLKHILDVEMSWKPGEHGMLRISGIVEEEQRTSATLEAMWQDKIALYDEEEGTRKPLFKGVVTSVQTVHRNGVYTVEIEAVSGSIYSDLKKRKRSFQDTSQTYEKIITTVLRAYPGGDVLLQKGEKEKPSEPVIQYEETDWELTKRLASQFQSVVVCDILEETPKLFIGMPEGKEHKLPDGASYTVSKDLAAFQKAGGQEAGLHDTDFFGYEIQSKTFYRLGDRFKIRGYIELIVSSMTARLEKGQLIYHYRLSREAGIREQPMMNRRLSGLTLQGEILAVKGEQVQVHLAIDDKQDKGTAHWYRYAPETGSAMYSMPQVGTKANLYLADAGGQEAIVTGGVRTNGASAEKTADPNNRYFGTEHGSEMKLSPMGVEFTGGSKEPLFLKLDDAVGIILSSPRKLTLTAKEEISLFTPKRVVIGAQALLVAKKTSAPSGITLEGEYNLMGAQIRTEGKDRTGYAPYDDAPVEGEPPPPPPPPPEKPPFSWKKLGMNVLAGLAVVVVVAAIAVVSVATLGAGAMLMVGAAAVIAGTAAVASQAVSDIARGEVSDTSTYMATAFRETIIGAISGAVFGPFGTFATLGGRAAFGAVQNGFESIIRQTMEGNGFSFGTLALDMGIGGLTGGIMDSRIAKAIGKGIKSGVGALSGWVSNGIKAVVNKLKRDAVEIKDLAVSIIKKSQNGYYQKLLTESAKKLGISLQDQMDKLGHYLGLNRSMQLAGIDNFNFSKIDVDPNVKIKTKPNDTGDLNGRLDKEVKDKGSKSKKTKNTKKTDERTPEYEKAMEDAFDNLPPYTRKPNKPREFEEKTIDEDTGIITYKLKSKKNGKIYNVKYDKEGFPIFDSQYETVLPKSFFLEPDGVQFKYLSLKLFEDIKKDPSLAEKFTQKDLDLLSKGKNPKSFTWHHHQDTGKMQLVDYYEHQVAGHTGGRAVWGGGEEGRTGKLKNSILEMME